VIARVPKDESAKVKIEQARSIYFESNGQFEFNGHKPYEQKVHRPECSQAHIDMWFYKYIPYNPDSNIAVGRLFVRLFIATRAIFSAIW
jgi:hypothetical protein